MTFLGYSPANSSGGVYGDSVGGVDYGGNEELKCSSQRMVVELEECMSRYKLYALGDLVLVLRGVLICLGREKAQIEYRLSEEVQQALGELILLRFAVLCSGGTKPYVNDWLFGEGVQEAALGQLSWQPFPTCQATEGQSGMRQREDKLNGADALLFPKTLDVLRVLVRKSHETTHPQSYSMKGGDGEGELRGGWGEEIDLVLAELRAGQGQSSIFPCSLNASSMSPMRNTISWNLESQSLGQLSGTDDG